MAKRNSQAKMRPNGSAGGRQIPWWIWFLGGLFSGLALSALVLMKQWAPQLQQTAAEPRAAAPAAAPAAADDKPKYEFYSVLPEMEVVVPDAEVKSAANANPPTPAANAAATNKQRFMLQAGSFRTSADADALKARLTLMGVGAPVSVAKVTIDGTEYFRVRVGPFADLRALDGAKRSLEGNGVNAIALRENGAP